MPILALKIEQEKQRQPVNHLLERAALLKIDDFDGEDCQSGAIYAIFHPRVTLIPAKNQFEAEK
jgi:hypothetical protein